jgi:hypothetical protein
MQPQPRAPRRFGPRWRAALAVLLPALAVLLVLATWVGVTSEGESEDVVFRFRVSDAETGRPIQGAFIRLFIQEKVARDLYTGPGGEAEMTAPCPVTVRTTLLSRRGRAAVPDWLFFVSSLGHKIAGPHFLRDFVGPRHEMGTATPVIDVRLEKQDPMPAGK